MRRVLVTVLFVSFIAAGAASTAAARRPPKPPPPPPGPTGYDISYPQVGGPFPTNVPFGIVGVNGGTGTEH